MTKTSTTEEMALRKGDEKGRGTDSFRMGREFQGDLTVEEVPLKGSRDNSRDEGKRDRKT